MARDAVAAGHPAALGRLALLRHRASDHTDAERLAREAAAAGHPFALIELAQLRTKASDNEGI